MCEHRADKKHTRVKRTGVRQWGTLVSGGDRRGHVPSAGDSSCRARTIVKNKNEAPIRLIRFFKKRQRSETVGKLGAADIKLCFHFKPFKDPVKNIF